MQLCDVVLVLPGPRRIPAHRIVLSSASDYFSAMFTNDVLEATQNEVNMKDVDPDAMTSLVQYMYDGEFEWLQLFLLYSMVAMHLVEINIPFCLLK